MVKISTCEKLLRVKTDYKLTFDNHVANLCKKANNKLKALARATSQMSIEKRNFLINSYFIAQLDYCPLCRCYIVVAITRKSSIYMKD